MKAKCLAVLGTGSDVGKSVVVTALCRIFSNLGIRVAPYKAQNMSNNSYVTRNGLEMGRAQIAQAEAARVEPTVDMNPVLLKPCGNTTSQVVVHGRAMGNRKAGEYFQNTDALFNEAFNSLDRLRDEYDLIVMEGAGSCAEVNLRRRDIVNFRMARAAGAPVLLTGDIDRGGVFAQLIGTLAVSTPEDREQVRGFIINRFRGEISLFTDGIRYIEEETRRPVMGVIPFFTDIEIDQEDGVALEKQLDPLSGPEPGKINLAVIRLPRISNYTDFAVLERIPSVALHYLARPRRLEGYDLVLLPGSKNVCADREWLKETGWDEMLHAHVQKNGRVGGICGGYQILGRRIKDPHGVEGPPGEMDGLGLLETETVLSREKLLRRARGIWDENGRAVSGYEIHMGVTERPADLAPAIRHLRLEDTESEFLDGARSRDGRIWGTYLHGLFDEADFTNALLTALDPSFDPGEAATAEPGIDAFKDRQYDLLAEHVSQHLDIQAILKTLDMDDLCCE